MSCNFSWQIIFFLFDSTINSFILLFIILKIESLTIMIMCGLLDFFSQSFGEAWRIRYIYRSRLFYIRFLCADSYKPPNLPCSDPPWLQAWSLSSWHCIGDFENTIKLYRYVNNKTMHTKKIQMKSFQSSMTF